ncbi:Lrp/AsnC family transcriptional regulator [Streptomyces himalayensis]|uniref:Lrp/AsnC family transcriptional regulator n=1 Tax=Streptomyces himalayensis subsp. himalayensis TaxID=2756131 RepID=A0A7W0IBQ4_9ACTN|nr:Lrp/AsnC family transcriptional regulator [Streptomyces himalayensis]MBA2949399.1 Lrp/AsnC family transcriptional regulator [Streptomyces himalayensis subsp. himalayensis]
MTQFELDDTDQALLAEVRRDGRATYEALSLALGLSRPAARARLQRLLDAQVLSIAGVVHPSVFGLAAYAHVAVAVDGPVLPVAEQVCAMRDAVYVSAVAGRFPLVAELRSADHDALADAVRRIAALPGVREARTAVYTEILQHAHFPPGPYQPAAIDDTDRALLERLQRDGRTPFAELGAAVGLSTSATRTRVLRLLESGAVHIGALVQPDALGATRMCGFQLTLDGQLADKALAAVRDLREVEYLASSIGRCDAIGTAASPSADGELRFLETLRAVPGVRSVESWAHLRLLKEDYSPAAAVSRRVGDGTSVLD